jgi:Tol biopolymer transport system component
MRLLEENQTGIFPCWSVDGQSLFYGSRARGIKPGLEMWRVGISGGAPEKLATVTDADLYSDISRDGRMIYLPAQGSAKVLDLTTGRTENLQGITGLRHAWSADGRRLAYAVAAQRVDDADAGLWVYDFADKPRQVFKSWAIWHAWHGSDELFVQEGKANLDSVIWRLPLDGASPERVGAIQITPRFWLPFSYSRFDVHPDGRRLAVESAMVGESDIGMLEEVSAPAADR